MTKPAGTFRQIILAALLLVGTLALGRAEHLWPDAPPEVLREELFTIRFRQIHADRGPGAAKTFLEEELKRGATPTGKAWVARVSLWAEGWEMQPLVPPAEAERLLNEAVESGSTFAMDILSQVRIEGVGGLRKAPKEGYDLLQRAAAAGNVRALSKLGYYRMHGWGVLKNVLRGAQEVRRAAVLGSYYGISYAAADFEKGWEGAAPSPAQAMEYYFLLAGYNEAGAWAKLKEYEEKQVPGAALLRSLAYLRFANDGGFLAPSMVRKHAAALAARPDIGQREWLELGIAHLEGFYAKRDYAKAQDYLQRAARGGNEEAKFFLAYARWRGLGVSQEKIAALAEMESLAATGNHRAANFLGCKVFWGNDRTPGLTKDPAKGFAYLRQAAEAGFLQARYNLAYSYKHGIGTPVNNVLAAKLYWEAAQGGIDGAHEELVRTLAFAKIP